MERRPLAADASAGSGSASRTDDAADVTLDVAVLGAGFLGHPIGGLLRAGLVQSTAPVRTTSWPARCAPLVAPGAPIGF